MAFTSFVPATFDEVLSQLASFCGTTLGWAANYDAAASTTTVTPKVGEADFVLSFTDNATYGHHIDCDVTKGAHSFQARVSHVAGLSNVWLFGGQTPEPWCHMVINSTPGQYHHLYFGYLERYGVWECGAVADGTNWSDSVTQRDFWLAHANHMLFSGLNSDNRTHGGGLILEGVNVTANVGRFTDYTSIAPLARLRGGFADEDNRRLITPGMPLHNAAAPMAPVMVRADFERDGFWVPVGAVPGVRMIHIDDLNPEQVITFGSNDWQVFPLADKNRNTYYQNWPEYQVSNTNDIVGGSQYMGVAVLRA